MVLTAEQEAIIQSTGDIKINAVAGSGKTTTIIEYARTRPKHSRILYLAFNKSVKLEAEKKFAALGLSNVKVETAHSLAYKHIVFRFGYKVRPQQYKTNEIAEILNLQGNGEKHYEYILANHINKFIAFFCNSNKQKVQELNYLDTIADEKAKTFVHSFYSYLEKQTRLLLSKMDKGEIDITHDFYLKKFQLSNPTLGFDYILFDEGQDASPAMLDVFFKQQATKIIVGDTHQQIYSWRYAVNSLAQANFKTFQLSTSFRFSQPIADLAMQSLSLKKLLGDYEPQQITGLGNSDAFKTKAILARTNLGLLLRAIEYVTETKKLTSIYFEGNINSYTYADEGASLYDVLNLYNYQHYLIRDSLIKSMNSLQDLEDYIEKTEDVQLAMMVEIVKEYGNEIPRIIKSIKDRHVENHEKEKADMVFSTVHRCKGMEYDAVHLVNDFITEEKIEKLKADPKNKVLNATKVNEEINLLYVAITRTKNTLFIPEALMPVDFAEHPQIHVIPELTYEEIKKPTRKFAWTELNAPPDKPVEKAYSVEAIREKNKAVYRPWTNELDQELTIMFCQGTDITEMATHFGRSKSAIQKRILKLELEDLYGFGL